MNDQDKSDQTKTTRAAESLFVDTKTKCQTNQRCMSRTPLRREKQLPYDTTLLQRQQQPGGNMLGEHLAHARATI